ncbi:hypothetical protein GCM10009641_64640 [Mycobacterium cookii]|uniref:Uncharacterized protein n=1 Tax=Nocardioides furvisabuli TaxID=375542 RepID=A0ABP5IF88_9ACTN
MGFCTDGSLPSRRGKTDATDMLGNTSIGDGEQGKQGAGAAAGRRDASVVKGTSPRPARPTQRGAGSRRVGTAPDERRWMFCSSPRASMPAKSELPP